MKRNKLNHWKHTHGHSIHPMSSSTHFNTRIYHHYPHNSSHFPHPHTNHYLFPSNLITDKLFPLKAHSRSSQQSSLPLTYRIAFMLILITHINYPRKLLLKALLNLTKAQSKKVFQVHHMNLSKMELIHVWLTNSSEHKGRE